ncbi:unnamed protein product [Rotaria socialis]|uniref:Nocturnin n=1 Tax=Rotaria socialis TaxID=392032 RepID=A0A820EWQ1_9BILA|nr:unnamed protein product [Rotaria socialis]CAF3485198.1 unnamed protein product [Rotaria socialis]CAF3577320.1 unnamed protein product [Rotaria socialis]CAF4161640.1 unnamed protein product [Rotaria socialis]CAF4255246.1 unnamed protein product [Rotaria socialis]
MASSAMNSLMQNEIKQYITPESLKRDFDGSISSSPSTIHVLQWNVLAQALSYTKDNFVRVNNDIVDFEKRKWRILEQIIIRRPDLCALEEMDIFNCFLENELPKYGYTCFFVPKINSKCFLFEADTKNFKGADGTLLCYKTDLFNELSRNGEQLPDDGRREKQIFAVLHLEHKPSSKKIVFIGTHFKSKKEFKASRLHQAEAIIEHLKTKYPTSSHVILAGDLNGDFEEPCYTELVNFGLKSAYRTKMGDKEPSYTTWTYKGRDGTEREQCKAIDYVFYSPKGFTPEAILQLPSKDDIGPNALPSINYPSDHLALEVILNIEQ